MNSAKAGFFLKRESDCTYKLNSRIALTESGMTPLWMSRIRSGIPIYCLSRHNNTCHKMTLCRGVYPIFFDVTQYEESDIHQRAIAELLSRDLLHQNDYVLITHGDVMGICGGTNAMKIMQVNTIDAIFEKRVP